MGLKNESCVTEVGGSQEKGDGSRPQVSPNATDARNYWNGEDVNMECRNVQGLHVRAIESL
jgi:hypothetical protein